MNLNLSPSDIEKINALKATRQHNNDVAWLLSDYLNNNPCGITKEWMDSLSMGGQLPEDTLYFALLSGLCGLDTENDELHKLLANNYLQPAVKHLNVADYAQNAYYRNIKIPETKFGNWQLTHTTYQPYEAFVYNDIVLTNDFREIPRIGFFSEEFTFPAVHENGQEWMAIKPNEIETMQVAIGAVSGHVVTFGLGLGYFAYMVSMQECVQSITVVERDEAVIALFRKHLLPQFAHPEKVRIIQSDAFGFMEKQMPAAQFNYAFVDLWHDVSDGLPLYLKSKKMESLSPQTEFMYWVEDSLLSALRWQVFDEVIATSKSYNEVAARLSNEGLREGVMKLMELMKS